MNFYLINENDTREFDPSHSEEGADEFLSFSDPFRGQRRCGDVEERRVALRGHAFAWNFIFLKISRNCYLLR